MQCEVKINTMAGINGRLNIVEEKISECENIGEIKHREGEMASKNEEHQGTTGRLQAAKHACNKRSWGRGQAGDSTAKVF